MKSYFIWLNILFFTVIQAAEMSQKEKNESERRMAELKGAAEGSVTPLMEAIEEGDKEKFEALFEPGKDLKINAQNIHGDTALHLAIAKGDKDILSKLLDIAGRDVTIENNDGFAPLEVAISEGNAVVIPSLIKLGANLNNRSFQGKKKIIAELQDKAQKSGLLADRVALWQAAHLRGLTPLMHAVKKGDPAIVKLLLDAEVNPTVVMVRDGQRLTALDLAPKDSEIAKLIVAKKKEFTDRSFELVPSYKRLSVFTLGEGGIASLKEIFEKGIDINDYPKYIRSPLLLAVNYELNDIAKELINFGANLEVKDGDGMTALYNAVEMKNAELVKILIDAGADINVEVPLKENDTVLDVAILNGNLEIYELLKNAGLKSSLNELEWYQRGKRKR